MLDMPTFDEGRALRDFFQEAGYTEKGLQERLGIDDPPAPQVRRGARIWHETVCNPPFVVLPGKEYTYRDSGMELDAFCRKLVREAPAYLNPGGYFQMICEWVEVEGQPWRDRISEWFEGTGCDAWVLTDYTVKPSRYAETRLRETIPVSEQRDMSVASFLVQLDGKRTLREAVAELAARVEADPAQVEPESLQVVRRMLDMCFLAP